VGAIAGDILEVDTDNPRAKVMLEQARVEQSLHEGQRAFVSLIFSDIVESTDLADVRDPETVRDLFKVYRQAAIEAIGDLDGNVLQFQGDGIVACFGYPNVHEDDARRAVLAGLELVERMAAAGPELHRAHGIDPTIRVAIHTGTVVVTGLTTGAADASDIVGAAAHIAARLQGEAEPGTVVISDATRQLVEGHFDLVPVGPRALKGIARPVEVFRVLRARRLGPPADEDRVWSVPLVGRDSTRALLRQRWHEVVAATQPDCVPRIPLVVLRGPAGIGKSRLAADLCEHVQREHGVVMQTTCSPYHTNVALWPIGRMLEHGLGLYPEQASDERVAVVERSLRSAGMAPAGVVPLLAPLLGLVADVAWPR